MQIVAFSTALPVTLEMMCVIHMCFFVPGMLMLITRQIVYVNILVTKGLKEEVSDHQGPVASEPSTGANKD